MRPVLNVVLSKGAVAPFYATTGAAGLDLRSTEEVTLEPMERKLVSTGLQIAVPEGFEAQVRPRSGLALKHGIALVNSPGTIDSDYRGEIGIIVINLGQSVVKLARGERVAQLVIAPVVRVEVKVVETIEDTDRGAGGFGSTGEN